MVNVDVKMASKAIARRLEAVMPLHIPANQNGFIKGRSILDAVRTIDDVFEICKIMNQSGILLAIDFEKAFDSLNHEFLYQVLQKMGFGPNFLQWIRTFYRNLSSCVLNNGFTTDIFFVKRGVRQGDPLSHLLFILALETLVCQIQENKNIKGFLINGKEIKTTLFADDMTCFLRDTNSHFQLLTSLQNFARYSGLSVNDEKTEIFAIGSHSLVQDVFTHKIRSMIKILAVDFNYNTPARLKVNCESIFKSIQGTLNSWKGRSLYPDRKNSHCKVFYYPGISKQSSVDQRNQQVDLSLYLERK